MSSPTSFELRPIEHNHLENEQLIDAIIDKTALAEKLNDIIHRAWKKGCEYEEREFPRNRFPPKYPVILDNFLKIKLPHKLLYPTPCRKCNDPMTADGVITIKNRKTNESVSLTFANLHEMKVHQYFGAIDPNHLARVIAFKG